MFFLSELRWNRWIALRNDLEAIQSCYTSSWGRDHEGQLPQLRHLDPFQASVASRYFSIFTPRLNTREYCQGQVEKPCLIVVCMSAIGVCFGKLIMLHLYERSQTVLSHQAGAACLMTLPESLSDHFVLGLLVYHRSPSTARSLLRLPCFGRSSRV